MATGIVFGRVTDLLDAPVTGARCVLDYVWEVSGATRADGLPIEPIGSPPAQGGWLPYGITGDTDTDGRYTMFYAFPGDTMGDLLGGCRFRVRAYRNDFNYTFLGAAHRIGGVVGVDIRNMVSACIPLDAFAGGQDSATTWLNFVADRMRALPRTSAIVRGALGTTLSTERLVFATRVDIRINR